MVRERQKRKILGIGLDNDDGHVRMTRAKNFHLIGGSQETHEVMQEKCVKFNEKLDARGKELENLEHREFIELAGECEMNLIGPPPQDA